VTGPESGRESRVDSTFWKALVVFVALAVVGVFLAVSPTTFVSATGDVDALRAIGAAIFAAGLAAFLVEAFAWDRARRGAIA
jgi:hypothetical protein